MSMFVVHDWKLLITSARAWPLADITTNPCINLELTSQQPSGPKAASVFLSIAEAPILPRHRTLGKNPCSLKTNLYVKPASRTLTLPMSPKIVSGSSPSSLELRHHCRPSIGHVPLHHDPR